MAWQNLIGRTGVKGFPRNVSRRQREYEYVLRPRLSADALQFELTLATRRSALSQQRDTRRKEIGRSEFQFFLYRKSKIISDGKERYTSD